MLFSTEAFIPFTLVLEYPVLHITVVFKITFLSCESNISPCINCFLCSLEVQSSLLGSLEVYSDPQCVPLWKLGKSLKTCLF